MEQNTKNYSDGNKLKKEHDEWRQLNFLNKTGFFPIFHGFRDHLKNLSGGSVALFIYLGLHSNNQTGECHHSIETISNYFDRSTRTISQWIKELEENGLIERIQFKFNGVSHTFIRPYGENANLSKDK